MAVVTLNGGPLNGQTYAIPDGQPTLWTMTVDCATGAYYDLPVFNTAGWSNQSIGSYTSTGSMTGSMSWNNVSWSWGSLPNVEAPIDPAVADARLAESRRTAHRHAIVRRRAVRKGRRLLLSMLDDRQMREYSDSNAFTVVAVDGRIFRLRKGGTVHEMGIDGHPKISHCIHLPYSYIDEDTLIALKLMLETDVGEFMKVANSRPLVACSV